MKYIKVIYPTNSPRGKCAIYSYHDWDRDLKCIYYCGEKINNSSTRYPSIDKWTQPYEIISEEEAFLEML